MGNEKDCQREVWNLFEKLSSWRDESQKQISHIINFHSSSVNKGINDLVREVDDLQAELSTIRKERNVLLETVGNLNGEIRHLSYKLPITQPLPEPEDNLDQDIGQVSSEEEIPDTTEHYMERPRLGNETTKEVEFLDYEDISDQNIEQQILRSPENTSEDFVCSESNFSFSMQENLTIHLENVHSKLELNDVGPGLNDELNNQSEISTFDILESNFKGGVARKTGDRKLKCEKCPYIPYNISSLKSHIKAVHDKIRNHVCGECGYAASQKINLKKHKNMVHRMGERKFKCDKCPCMAHYKYQVKQHFSEVHLSIKRRRV